MAQADQKESVLFISKVINLVLPLAALGKIFVSLHLNSYTSFINRSMERIQLSTLGFTRIV